MEKDCSARLRRAVQENNLFLVKRLVQRTDVNMRNPDPGHSWYTSLAWAAVLGHEETFEFLLNANHDDRELSKDADDNTILMMLAEVKIQKKSVFGYGPPPIDMAGATLRMARLYLERYPFVLDWSNSSGKTALHVASLKGREDFVRMFCDFGADVDLPDEEGNTPLHYASAWGHIPIVQLLIERGCQYNTQNNEGFTPSDYAYSISTRDTLQDTARNQFESNKKARRVFAQAAARGKEWSSGEPSSQPGDATRLRRGSGTSGHASGSGSDVEGTPSAPPYATYSGALPTSLSHLNGSTSSSSSFTLSSAYRNGTPVHPPLANHASPLTPIATRTLQQDADAMEKYMRRNRSGSASTDIKSLSSNPSSAGPSANGDDISSLPLSGSVGPRRKLRPSVSAAQLRNTKPQSGSTTPDGTRLRSGTSTTNVRANPPTFSPPLDSRGLPPLPSRTHSRSNGVSVPEHGPEAFIGPPSEYAKFPAPPPTKESVVANSTLLGGSTASSIVTSPTTSRRLPLNLFSKPLPSIDQAVGHRRGSSSHSIR